MLYRSVSKSLVLALFSAVLLSACSSMPRSEVPSRRAELSDVEVLEPGSDSRSNRKKESVAEEDLTAPGFEFRLSSPSDKSLQGKFRVDWDRRLRLPYDVKIDTTGLTVEQTRQKALEAYQQYFKGADAVQVELVNRLLWIEVRGLVTKPGRYLVRRASSIEEIIAHAGGLSTTDALFVKIQQPRTKGPRVLDLKNYFNTGNSGAPTPKWRGGDILFFQREAGEVGDAGTNQVHILGDVKNPGNYYVTSGSDLLQYIVKAGGSNPSADLEDVTLFRTVDGVRTQYSLNIIDPRDHWELQAEDTVIIPAFRLTPAERALSMASQIAGLISTIAVLILAL